MCYQVLFRVNFLTVVLCVCMNRPYQFYYFVPLVSFWLVVLYTTLACPPSVTAASLHTWQAAVARDGLAESKRAWQDMNRSFKVRLVLVLTLTGSAAGRGGGAAGRVLGGGRHREEGVGGMALQQALTPIKTMSCSRQQEVKIDIRIVLRR